MFLVNWVLNSKKKRRTEIKKKIGISTKTRRVGGINRKILWGGGGSKGLQNVARGTQMAADGFTPWNTMFILKPPLFW